MSGLADQLTYPLPKVGDSIKRAGTEFVITKVTHKLDKSPVPVPSNAVGMIHMEGQKGAHQGFEFVGFLFSSNMAKFKKVGEVSSDTPEPDPTPEPEPQEDPIEEDEELDEEEAEPTDEELAAEEADEEPTP